MLAIFALILHLKLPTSNEDIIFGGEFRNPFDKIAICEITIISSAVRIKGENVLFHQFDILYYAYGLHGIQRIHQPSSCYHAESSEHVFFASD